MYNSFSYTTGNPNFKGESFLHVTADGSATVKATRGANSETYTADLSPKENKDFWNAVTQLNPCSLKNSRLGQPGEDMLKFSVNEGESDACQAEIWADEQHKMPLLKDLVKQVNAVLSKVSGGKVTY